MKKLTFYFLVLLLVACDNNEKENSLYGEWYRVKTVEIEKMNGEEIRSEEFYNPNSDHYLSAEIITISKEVMYTLTFSETAVVDSNIAYQNPKSNLDYAFESDLLVIYQRVSFPGGTIEFENYYERYKGSIPPQSWIDNANK